MGWGTYGSRSTPVGSGALMGAIAKIKEKAKIVTAHLLEAAVEDIDYADGKFFVKGSPGKFKTIQDVALMANVAWNYPKGLEPGLEASAFFDPPNFVYPFGAHIAVVGWTRETGEIQLERYVAVDDCGRVINPMIVEGQIHGGIVQGIGQALWEGAVYDDDGQLLTGSMMDYALPKADVLPDLRARHDRDADHRQSARRQGHRRDRHDRLDPGRLQRRDGRARAARRRRSSTCR